MGAEVNRFLAVLQSSGLPTDGLRDHLATALVAREDGVVIGSAALDCCSRAALLRSVAVVAAKRGQHLGERLTSAALNLALARGITDVYLLTEMAQDFFPRFGFHAIPRQAVAPAVQRSVEWTSACPVTAQAMRATLDQESGCARWHTGDRSSHCGHCGYPRRRHLVSLPATQSRGCGVPNRHSRAGNRAEKALDRLLADKNLDHGCDLSRNPSQNLTACRKTSVNVKYHFSDELCWLLGMLSLLTEPLSHPERRGFPRKTKNEHQFPGKVLSIDTSSCLHGGHSRFAFLLSWLKRKL